MKRILSFALALVILCQMPFVCSAAAAERLIITCGDTATDYMAGKVLKQINPQGDDFAKIKAVYDWIIYNCDRYEDGHTAMYTEEELTNGASALESTYTALLEQGKLLFRDPYSSIPENEFEALCQKGCESMYSDGSSSVAYFAGQMLMYRFGHCGNYASLLTVLLGLMGYECHNISGYFLNADGTKPEHIWNYVMVNGKYYWLDVRMDHATFVRNGAIDYKYFMIEDTTVWERNHEWDRAYSDLLYKNRDGQTLGLHAFNSYFWDTVTHWSRKYVNNCYEKGYFSGVSESMFDPDGVMTRAMLVSVLYRLDGNNQKYTPAFSDVAQNKWFSTPIGWAQHTQIVKGVSDDKFAPDANVTREQTAAILYRYAQSVGMDVTAKGDLTVFTDANKVSKYANNAISWVVGCGIINGKGNGLLDPLGSATRAELAKIFTDFGNMYTEFMESKEPVTEQPETDYSKILDPSSADDMAALAQRVTEYLNAQRAEKGVDLLTVDDALVETASARAELLAKDRMAVSDIQGFDFESWMASGISGTIDDVAQRINYAFYGTEALYSAEYTSFGVGVSYDTTAKEYCCCIHMKKEITQPQG